MRLVRETLIVLRYIWAVTARGPVWIIVGLFQPTLWLLLFAPLLRSLADSGGLGVAADETLTLFAPGALVMVALYGVLFVPFQIVADGRNGLIERLLVTPASTWSFVLGRVLRDVMALTLQSLLLLGIAYLSGLRTSLAGAALLVVMVVILGAFVAAFCYTLALALRDENGVAVILNFVTLPLFLLSGIILPLALAPSWMRTAAVVNPFRHAVDAGRDLLAGSLAEPTVYRGFAISLVLLVVTMTLLVRLYRRAGDTAG